MDPAQVANKNDSDLCVTNSRVRTLSNAPCISPLTK